MSAEKVRLACSYIVEMLTSLTVYRIVQAYPRPASGDFAFDGSLNSK